LLMAIKIAGAPYTDECSPIKWIFPGADATATFLTVV